MTILRNEVREDIVAGRALNLELGSGGQPRQGFYGLDVRALPGVDIQANLNKPLDFLPDNSVANIFSQHCLEHVSEFETLMSELHRVVRPEGSIEIVVPHFSNPFYYSDPTHVRFFGLFSFHYFVRPERQKGRRVPFYYEAMEFKIHRIHVSLLPRSLWKRLIYPGLRAVINKSFERQERWERSQCWSVPADSITYWLSPVKAAPNQAPVASLAALP
jgi:SAM-dependent methyltransferase